MLQEVGAEPPDLRTKSAGLETGEACQKTSHSQPRGQGGGLGGEGGLFLGLEGLGMDASKGNAGFEAGRTGVIR